MGYPERAVCVKLTESSGSRGVRIIDAHQSQTAIFLNSKPTSLYTTFENMKTILKGIKHLSDIYLMEYLPGDEYTVDLLAENGKILYMAGRRNVVSVASIAQESILVKNAKAFEMCETLVSLLQLDGNIGFDFMFNQKNEPRITDINPRVTATVSIIEAGGLNLPYLRVKQLLKETLPEISVNYGVKMKRRYLEMFTDENGVRINEG